MSKSNIVIICGSTRAKASSANVSRYILNQLDQDTVNVSMLDLHTANIPLWQEGAEADKDIQNQLNNADGFVFVVPEWHGMVPPAVKNLFYYFTKCFAHKPAFLVGVSAGTGGRYPLTEMRASTYKNTFLNYIPVSCVIDKVNETFDEDGKFIAPTDYIAKRLHEGLLFLKEYSAALTSVRNSDIAHNTEFGNGM